MDASRFSRMYISYTYARIYSALSKTTITDSIEEDFTESDIGFAWHSQLFKRTGWIRSRKTMDFANLANYAHHLARKLGNATF